MKEWPVDFGTSILSDDMARKCRGYRSDVVQRGWANRRKEERKKAIAEREKEANLLEKLKQEKQIKEQNEKLEKQKEDAEEKEACSNNVSIDVCKIEKTNPTTPLDAANQAVSIGFRSIKDAILIISALYDVHQDEIIGKSRKVKHIEPRHAAMCAVKIMWPDASLPYIGRYFARDHTTVLHALRKNGVLTAQEENK